MAMRMPRECHAKVYVMRPPMGRRRRLSAIRAALAGPAAGDDVDLDPHPSSQRPLRIAIVLGTTRDGRQGHRVALFCQLALEAAGHAVTLIDPRETRPMLCRWIDRVQPLLPQLLGQAKFFIRP